MHTDIMTTFNEHVRIALKRKQWTIKRLADEIGSHRETLSNILNGHSDTLMGTAQKIADALGVPLKELVDEDSLREAPRKPRGKKEPQAA